MPPYVLGQHDLYQGMDLLLPEVVDEALAHPEATSRDSLVQKIREIWDERTGVALRTAAGRFQQEMPAGADDAAAVA